METVLVEIYTPRDSAVAELADEACAAAAALHRQGVAARYLRTIFVPDDETCFHVFDGASVVEVARGLRDTALRSGRVTAAVAASARHVDHQRRKNA